MSPAAVLERHDPFGAITPEARTAGQAYLDRCREMASLAGVLNATHGALVDVAVQVLAEGDHVGPGLHSPGQFLAWRIGCSKQTANQLVAIARRAHELPVLLGALREGAISLEQAVVVARNVPASFDASATALAKEATVEQLRSVLPAYRYDEETPDEQAARERRAAARRERSGGLFRDEDGGARLTVHLDPAQAAALEAAIAAARDDLHQQRRADAAAAAEAGSDGPTVELPTLAETTAALAASALAAGQLAHPGSERYLITYHLGAGPDGSPCLTDERGRVVADGERRRLLCDHRFEAIVHAADGTALSVGRATRHIGRKLRRVILRRHHGRCAVPGCDASHHLEVHHIVHWEDGGATDTGNLLALCHRHHRAHHEGLIEIAGDADLPPGTPGCITISVHGRALDTSGTPVRVPHGQSVHDAHQLRTGHRPPPASTPCGERLQRRTLHLHPVEPPPAPEADESAPPPADPSVSPPRHRHHTPATGRSAPCARPEANGPPEAR